ncbi:MAG TPA: cell division protein, partial [Marinobacter adhaerens]|nr:cell division protein [Marinobacter adhaerens]
MAADPRKKAQPTRGANQARAPWREQAESYFIHHRKVARDSANRLLHTPVASLMTWTVMGVALALPVALLLLLTSLQGVSAGWESSARVTAYIELDVPLERARVLGNEISGDGRVAGVELVDRDQALAEFRASSGLEDALDYLEDNPLP